MKFFLLFTGFLVSVFFGYAQGVVISATNPSTPINPNVILQINSGTQGVQLPQMDSTARLGITVNGVPGPNGNAGIIVFDTTTGSPWYTTTSGAWINVANKASAMGWSLYGNAGTVDTTNFIGTTDSNALSFRVYNQPSGRIDPARETTFFGYQAGMNNAGFGNTANGYQALFSNTSGYNNLANGWMALYSNTTGSGNSANGASALYMNTTGYDNSANGYAALYNNTTGKWNTSAGYESLPYNSTGNANTASGYYSLGSNISGSGNVAIGVNSLYANTATSNLVAIGDSALFSNTAPQNTAVGYQALGSNTSGAGNTAVGYGSLRNNSTGSAITAFGALTSEQAGSFITLLGYSAGAADGIMDATAIGSNANVTSPYTIQLGDNSVTAVNSYGTFTTISDGRFKFNIREDVSGLDFIMRLRPVTYQLDTRKIANGLVGGKTLASFAASNNETPAMNIRRTGFIAQEVEKAADESGFDFDAVKKPQNDKDHYSLSYQEFVVPLVKAVQEQQKEIEDLKKEIEDLKKVVAKFSRD